MRFRFQMCSFRTRCSKSSSFSMTIMPNRRTALTVLTVLLAFVTTSCILLVALAPAMVRPRATISLRFVSCAQLLYSEGVTAVAELVPDHRQLRLLPSHTVRVFVIDGKRASCCACGPNEDVAPSPLS